MRGSRPYRVPAPHIERHKKRAFATSVRTRGSASGDALFLGRGV